MATQAQKRFFAQETLGEARALRDIMQRIKARGERWNALTAIDSNNMGNLERSIP